MLDVYAPEGALRPDDGYWGGNGRVTHLAEILGRVTDPEAARALADERIAASRAGRTVLPG